MHTPSPTLRAPQPRSGVSRPSSTTEETNGGEEREGDSNEDSEIPDELFEFPEADAQEFLAEVETQQLSEDEVVEVFAAILTEKAGELEDQGGGDTLAAAKGGTPARGRGKKARTSRRRSRRTEGSSPRPEPGRSIGRAEATVDHAAASSG